jgi:hypothetical protein
VTTVDPPGPITVRPIRGRLSDQQVRWLLDPPDRSRIQQLQGHSHLEGWDVRRWLIRVFGHGGWDQHIVEAALVAEWETDEDRPVYRNGSRTDETKRVHYFHAIYRATLRLTVRDLDGRTVATYEDVATGDAKGPARGDAHDQALKGAATQALKRCAVNLGDLFGLSLYNGGGLRPVVSRTADTDVRWGKADAPREPDEPVQGSTDPTVEPATPETDGDRAGDATAAAPPPAQQLAAAEPRADQGPPPAGQPVQFPPARGASRQERAEAKILVEAAEKLAARGAVEGWRKVWAQAKAAGLLDVVPADASREESLITVREHLHRYGLIANEVAAANPAPTGEPCPAHAGALPEFSPELHRWVCTADPDCETEWDQQGHVIPDSAEDAPAGASLEQWAGVGP